MEHLFSLSTALCTQCSAHPGAGMLEADAVSAWGRGSIRCLSPCSPAQHCYRNREKGGDAQESQQLTKNSSYLPGVLEPFTA